ncbi:MAG: DUF998 domain-containing protein [Maribacter sp.]
MKFLIRQAKFAPIFYFVPVFMAGLLIDDYNLVKQHASEITIASFYYAKTIINAGFILTGSSISIFALGIIIDFKKFYISSIMLIVFGISMISNGLYPMGTHMHGIHGIGLAQMLLPFIVCYEVKNENFSKLFFKLSLITGFLIFIYFWSMIVGLDPVNYMGLTQRIASAIILGWIAFFAFELKKIIK